MTMTCASRVQRRNGFGPKRTDRQDTVTVTANNWREGSPFRSLEEMLANPDFLPQATETARRDARSTRLAVILQAARPLASDLGAVERPLDVLNSFGPTASPVDAFTTISTLFFVPWAHGDCSQKVVELQRTGEALQLGSHPMTAFYEAVALDARTRRNGPATCVTVSLHEKKLEMALETYTKALTGWMRAVLA
jgi:hypothetical protein